MIVKVVDLGGFSVEVYSGSKNLAVSHYELANVKNVEIDDEEVIADIEIVEAERLQFFRKEDRVRIFTRTHLEEKQHKKFHE